MGTSRDIAEQLIKWFRKWGAIDDAMGDQLINFYLTGSRPTHPLLMRNADLADFRLRTWYNLAADELEALLREIGMDPRPGNREAREHNGVEFPRVNPHWLIDLLTVIHDLRTFGPTPQFRTEQTFETILKWIRALSRSRL